MTCASPMNMKSFLSIFLLFCLNLFVGCTGDDIAGGGSDIGNPGPVSVASFDDAASLEFYLKEEFASGVLSSDSLQRFDTDVLDSGLSGTGDEAITASASQEPADYSTTNIQEAEVDEADKVKTDGEYFYIAKGQTVKIVNAAPDYNMEILHTIFINGTVDSLYLYNNTLAVIYTPLGYGGKDWPSIDPILPTGDAALGCMPYWLPVEIKTGIVFYDIGTPSAPIHQREIVIEGALISTRLTKGKLLLIQQFLPDLPPIQLWYDGTETNKDEVVWANIEALDATTLTDLTPSYQEFDAEHLELSNGMLIEPANFYRPIDPDGGSMVTITTFDLKETNISYLATGIVADAQQIYASTSSLYLASYHRQWFSDSSESESEESTNLHKFDISGNKAVWQAGGQVNGRILNQFSMGEYENVLRVAVTTGETWNNSSKNHLYCLRANNDNLNLDIIGSIEDMAPGESIYSARFMGTRGYLVTYVSIDPLFTIDLSDPNNPQVLGELKVPGYSNYIHPLGDNHILTIGKDTQEQNGITWYQGMQMSIFDVSDFSQPFLLHKELLGDRGTESEALHNHKAFTYWAEQDLLTLPVTLYTHPYPSEKLSAYGNFTFAGLYVYRVTAESGFELVGRINTQYSGGYYFSNWMRGIFIDNSVFAVNEEFIKSADIEDITNTINSLALE